MERTVRMLGTRGVPANHGGFETAAENIGLRLVERGWRVVVYCQEPSGSERIWRDEWNGIERVHVPERFGGPLGTIWFDTMALRHAARTKELCLTFGYNTGFLTELLRQRGIPTVINMDGVEWQRARWKAHERHFLHLNEILACRLADHLIADHPVIYDHLRKRAPRARISTVTYGAPDVTAADPSLLGAYGVQPGRYLTVIARPVPENSILEMVRAFSRRPRGVKLLVLGNYADAGDYAQHVRAAAGPEVLFPGAVYDAETVQSIRFHSAAYLHGHTVGGTNPSLVEALGCQNPVIAHDNVFNRWVAQDAALYFEDEGGFDDSLQMLLADPALAKRLSKAAVSRHAETFTWERITDQYEEILELNLPRERTRTGLVALPRQRGRQAESVTDLVDSQHPSGRTGEDSQKAR